MRLVDTPKKAETPGQPPGYALTKDEVHDVHLDIKDRPTLDFHPPLFTYITMPRRSLAATIPYIPVSETERHSLLRSREEQPTSAYMRRIGLYCGCPETVRSIRKLNNYVVSRELTKARIEAHTKDLEWLANEYESVRDRLHEGRYDHSWLDTERMYLKDMAQRRQEAYESVSADWEVWSKARWTEHEKLFPEGRIPCALPPSEEPECLQLGRVPRIREAIRRCRRILDRCSGDLESYVENHNSGDEHPTQLRSEMGGGGRRMAHTYSVVYTYSEPDFESAEEYYAW